MAISENDPNRPHQVFYGDCKKEDFQISPHSTLYSIGLEYRVSMAEFDSSQSDSSQMLNHSLSNRFKEELTNKKSDLLGGVALISDKNLPLFKNLEKLIDESFPLVFVRIKKKSQVPLFVFNKNDAYHKYGQVFKRVTGFKMDTLPCYLSNVAYILQLFEIKDKIEAYQQKIRNGTITKWEYAKFAGEFTSLCTGSLDYIKILSKVGYEGAVGTIAKGATLSAIGQMIGTFILGWELGNLIGNIPCGEGKVVQDHIDRFINAAWEHPYKTMVVCPLAAMHLNAYKKTVIWNINRISAMKPLTQQEKRALESYNFRNKKMYIRSESPQYYIKSKQYE